MKLTKEQLNVIRECTVDETAYQRVLEVLDRSPVRDTSPPNVFDDLPNLVIKAIDRIPIAIYIKDKHSRFVMANQKVLKLMKLDDPADLIGKSDMNLIYEPEASYHYQMEQELIATGVPIVDLEIYVDEKYGDPHWYLTTKLPIYDDTGDIVGLVGINRDITKQKQVEQKLQEERNLLTILVNNLRDHVYVKDTHGRILIANDAVAHTFGLPDIQDIIGKTDFELMPEPFASKFHADEQTIFEQGVVIEHQEMHLFTGPEAGQWIEINKFPVFDAVGDVVMLVGINRNITDQKISIQHQIETQINQSRKEILNDFIMAALHEFLTPLTVILSASYLCGQFDDSKKRSKYVKQIEGQIADLNRLIHSLILVVQLEQNVNPQHALFSVTSLYSHLMREIGTMLESEPRALEQAMLATDARLLGDLGLLQEAFTAILKNAVQYTEDNDTIRIRATADDDNLVISIEDTGIGMSDETQLHMFEDFYRMDKPRSSRGFGLGLSIAQRIVEFHKGKIQAESELGVGTKIIVRLPLAPDSHQI